MEIILALTGIGVVCFFIYRSLPRTKYLIALDLINLEKYNEAIIILNKIFEKHVDAPSQLAACNLRLGQKAKSASEKLHYFKKVTALRKRITKLLSVSQFDIVEAEALFEIAKIQYEETNGDIEKLNQNLRFIDVANKKDLEADFASLRKQHYNDLANSLFARAKYLERYSNYSEALKIYAVTALYAENADNKTVQYDSVARSLICQMKMKEIVCLDNYKYISKSDRKIQKELYYRYIIHLLKNKEFSKAEEILALQTVDSVLKSSNLRFRSQEIGKLCEVIKAEKNNVAVKKVAEINAASEKLYNNALALDELKALYESLDKTIEDVKYLDKELSERMLDVKLTLFNRLLSNYISVEKYSNAINIIQKYPKFWESTELLKNYAICCFGFTANGLLTERNYRTIISGWLTAVYSDQIIVKSLEGTSWDDDYTFTLSESIGSNLIVHLNLPENVNYDRISEYNISIGAIQKELLQQFEALIHKDIKDSNLANLVIQFYDSEKEAIEKAVNVFQHYNKKNNGVVLTGGVGDVCFCTPYFAKSHQLNNEFVKMLDLEYFKNSNEKALEAGVHYIINSKSSVVYQYLSANNLVEELKSSIANESLAAVRKLNTPDNKRLVERFQSVLNSVEDKLLHSLENKISEDDENESLISIVEECISFCKYNEKLKHQYSNYVTNYIISKVNSEEMSNVNALSILKRAYSIVPNSPRICQSLVTLIKFNLMDILNDRVILINEVYKILDWVESNRSTTFKQYSHEFSQARAEILDQLKKAGVDLSMFDYRFSALAALEGKSLSLEGLKMRSVLTYLKNLDKEIPISQEVSELLNEL